MAKWVAFYKEHETWILFALAWLLSIPGGIISNRLDSYLKNRSLTAKKRKIATLLAHYREVVEYREYFKMSRYLKFSQPKNKLRVDKQVMLFLFGLTLLFTFFMYIIDNTSGDMGHIYARASIIVFYPVMVYAMISALRLRKVYTDAADFYRYRNKTKAKLKELGGNPERLDSIDEQLEFRHR